MISESIQMSQSTTMQELEKLMADEVQEYPLGPTIAHAYLSVLKDCESHCFSEGTEVKGLGGLHVIGTSLYESRRIDNQVRCNLDCDFVSSYSTTIPILQSLSCT